MYEPKLRFPGYTEPLERISCGELFQERKEKGQDHLPILTLSIHTGISDHELDDEESIKKVKRSEDKSLYKRVYPNDLAFNMMRAWQGAFGVSKVDGMISPAYIVAEPIKEINADYLNYYIQTARFIGAANNLSYGVTDFRKRLYWNSFCKIELHLPSLEEQNKIAALLVSIDNTIDKQKEMISAWEERKKGVMQKLFSQEVRFKADDGNEFPEWEEKRFSEMYQSIPNKQYQISTKEYKKCGKYKVIDQGKDFIAGYFDDKSKVYKSVPVIIYGDHTTVVKYLDEPFVIGADGTKLLDKTSNDFDIKFLYFALDFNNVKQMGYKRHFPVLKEIPFTIPSSIAEQQKIADCLSALDKVIEKQKARLTAWEELKKGLLHQLFV